MNAVLKPLILTETLEHAWNKLSSSLNGLRTSSSDLRTLAQRSVQVPPIIVVGAGPAAQECARQLSVGMSPDEWVLLINGEQHLPYHRAQLSSVLAAGRSPDALLAHGFSPNVTLVHGVHVAVIEPQHKLIFTDGGIELHYRKLVLATGALSRRPVIPGLQGSRVFDFRQLQDVEKIAALAPQRIAVLGGGLLGIEAARALKTFCSEVTILVRGSHLLSRQVDEGAGECLAWHLRSMGIRLLIGTHVAAVDTNFGQVVLHDERESSYSFDAIICATGISPNIELAARAQLHYHLGIEVNDQHQTSDPDIYAIGECSERSNKTAGNLSATLADARRATASILEKPFVFPSHAEVFQLKTGSCSVITIGNVAEDGKQLVFAPNHGSYSRVFVQEQQVVGAILVGDVGLDFSSFTDAVERHLPWSDTIEKRFLKTGQLPHSATIPPDTVICFCTGTSYGKLTELRDAKLDHAEITTRTGASLHCGSCAQRVACITSGVQSVGRVSKPKGLWAAIALSVVLITVLVTAASVPIADSWQSRWRLVDVLWRDNVIRQITGYVFLMLMLLAFVPAWKRRSQREEKKPQSMSLMSWHLISACIVMAGFVVHTGARMGHGLNASLGLIFVSTLMLGGVASIAWRQASGGARHRAISKYVRAAHWALLFPLPAMLVFHVIKVYYF